MPLPEGFVSLGRTAGFPANGAVSNLALTPDAVVRAARELREGGYDVVHIHEPVVPLVGWDAPAAAPGSSRSWAPSTPTPRTLSRMASPRWRSGHAGG